MIRLLLTCLIVLSLWVSPSLVSATAVTADGSFHQFRFGVAGTPSAAASSCGGICTATTNPVAEQTSSPPWTFSGPGTLFVLDLLVVGDRFEVFDNLVSLGITSVVVNDGANPCGGNIGCATGNLAYSQASFALGAGSHSVTLNVVQNAAGFTAGEGVFRVSANAVPEPGSLMLVVTGFLGVGLVARRRR